ncbi:hypothetical protein GCM10010302_40610 [Streptomyces polychromogenes]|uniref:Uncharacterized protein n=1 Tax=Streptomyces polychromogenes TaxID=67342 RepID=A0ABP3F391_9ACTN
MANRLPWGVATMRKGPVPYDTGPDEWHHYGTRMALHGAIKVYFLMSPIHHMAPKTLEAWQMFPSVAPEYAKNKGTPARHHRGTTATPPEAVSGR